MMHVRWIFPSKPECPECGKRMKYLGPDRSGRSRYVICMACRHRGMIMALGREVTDREGLHSITQHY